MGTATIYNDSAINIANLLPPESVQTVVTSPPYYGLRDYGVDGQIGLEETPEQYVAALVEVFRAVREVLRPDGTLWLNLGDSYWGSGGANNNSGITGRRPGAGVERDERHGPVSYRQRWGNHGALKPKDLIGIPWRVAFALQAAGWYLRSDIIWAKPNPMPESATDRPTRAHEYLFLLSKSERYYYDADAIAEPAVSKDPSRTTFKRQGGKMAAVKIPGEARGSHRANRKDTAPTGTRNRRSVWTIATKAFPEAHFATFPERLPELCILAGSKPGDVVLDPFAGSGTTLLVAERLGRRGVGTEINPEYIEIAKRRLSRVQLAMNL